MAVSHTCILSRSDLYLLCTHGVTIVDMLAHSPPLAITINYWDGERETTKEDEEGILLALRHSDHLHYIALYLLIPLPLGRSSQLWMSNSQSWNASVSGLGPKAIPPPSHGHEASTT